MLNIAHKWNYLKGHANNNKAVFSLSFLGIFVKAFAALLDGFFSFIFSFIFCEICEWYFRFFFVACHCSSHASTGWWQHRKIPSFRLIGVNKKEMKFRSLERINKWIRVVKFSKRIIVKDDYICCKGHVAHRLPLRRGDALNVNACRSVFPWIPRKLFENERLSRCTRKLGERNESESERA